MVSSDKESGSVPTSRFRARSRAASDRSDPMLSGIGPVRALLRSRRRRNPRMRLMVWGMRPVKEFPTRCSSDRPFSLMKNSKASVNAPRMLWYGSARADTCLLWT